MPSRSVTRYLSTPDIRTLRILLSMTESIPAGTAGNPVGNPGLLEKILKSCGLVYTRSPRVLSRTLFWSINSIYVPSFSWRLSRVLVILAVFLRFSQSFFSYSHFFEMSIVWSIFGTDFGAPAGIAGAGAAEVVGVDSFFQVFNLSTPPDSSTILYPITPPMSPSNVFINPNW